MTTTHTTPEVPVSTIAPASAILYSRCTDKVDTGDGVLTITQLAWPAGTASDMIDFTPAQSATLTSDGRYAITNEWHTGPEAEWVQVQRWDTTGRAFHGFVDSVSRKLLQTG